MPLVKIKEKGQVTLPAKIRERRGLHAGDYMEVLEEGDRIAVVRGNGKLLLGDGVSGVDASGPLAFSSEAPMHFRNIFIRELKKLE